MNDKRRRRDKISRDTGMHNSMAWSCINSSTSSFPKPTKKRNETNRNQKGVSSSSIISSQFIPIYLLCSKLIPLHHLFPILHIMLINVLVGHDFWGWCAALSKFQRLSNYWYLIFFRFIVQFNNVHRYQRIREGKTTRRINLCHSR